MSTGVYNQATAYSDNNTHLVPCLKKEDMAL